MCDTHMVKRDSDSVISTLYIQEFQFLAISLSDSDKEAAL